MNGMEELKWLRKECTRLVEENEKLRFQLAAEKQANNLMATETDQVKKLPNAFAHA